MTVFYIDPLLGNDSNAGTSEGFGNAWASIGHALDTAGPGDIVWLNSVA